jgi:predicted transcriptional regulator
MVLDRPALRKQPLWQVFKNPYIWWSTKRTVDQMHPTKLRNTFEDSKPNYAPARKKAAEILARFGVSRPPVDPEIIAENLGFDVVYVDFADAVSREIAGLYDFASRKIYINKHMPTNRKTFTIAHELAHALLHEEYAKSQEYRAMPRSNYYMQGKPHQEVEADVFAACLLVPKDMLNRYKNFADIDELSDMFSVSPEVIVNQLKFS